MLLQYQIVPLCRCLLSFSFSIIHLVTQPAAFMCHGRTQGILRVSSEGIWPSPNGWSFITAIPREISICIDTTPLMFSCSLWGHFRKHHRHQDQSIISLNKPVESYPPSRLVVDLKLKIKDCMGKHLAFGGSQIPWNGRWHLAYPVCLRPSTLA